jgi:N6-L-threonylcarbamoyladenine synthase
MILSIESSCDDSSIAVTSIDDYRVIFHRKISQEQQHSIYGGVVPELASRLHAKELPYILSLTKEYLPSIKAVAVTTRPGLSVTLLEGVMMAKALSVVLDIPLIGVDHLIGHIYSLFIEKDEIVPQTILLLSGGHTKILEFNSFDDIKSIASTSDDSFGESFDKVAKMLSLGYPGGPIVEKLAKDGDENRYNFPIPLSKSPRLEFSYSGLKNAVRLAIQKSKNLELDGADIAASFQKSAVAHIIQKSKKHFKSSPPTNVAIVGGASANIYLRDKVQKLCDEFGAKLYLTDLKYTSDNAAMIGRVGVKMYKMGYFTKLQDLDISPKSKI